MTTAKVTEAAARVAEFTRQARNLSSIDKGKLYVVWTDPSVEQATLTLDDLETLSAAAPIIVARELRAAADAFEELLRERTPTHWRGQDFEDGLEAATESMIELLRSNADSALKGKP